MSTGASSNESLGDGASPFLEMRADGGQVNEGGNQQDQLSMNNIVDFLKDHQRQVYSKEAEWLFEKQQMQNTINQIDGQLKAQESINNDLIKRIKMLEFSLRQERLKYAKVTGTAPNVNTDIINSVMMKANLNSNLYEKIAKRRAKAQRPLLLKFLQEIGYEDIFNSTEIKEIKDLYDKAQAEMQENLNNPNILQEKLLMDEGL
jgi:hypothetical protein